MKDKVTGHMLVLSKNLILAKKIICFSTAATRVLILKLHSKKEKKNIYF
jgi:hypothetical protein